MNFFCLGVACVLLFSGGVSPLKAQSTYGSVYTLLQNKCASCHNSTQPAGNLNLSGTQTEVYNALIEVAPANATAAAKGYKRIDKGQPYRSFLLRKVNNGLIHALDAALDSEEGSSMPPYGGGTPLTNPELELIRQWIYAGAPQTGNVVNQNLINQYYAEGGMTPIDRPEPPAPGEGFQVHFGPIFMAPADEKEFSLKYPLQLPNDIEVKSIDLKMNPSSHHFILFKWNGTSANNEPDGIRTIDFSNIPFLENSEMQMTWQYQTHQRLPAGTAFFWDNEAIMDLNLHIPNYSANAIMPTDVYMNIYTQPTGTAIKEMKSELAAYNGFFTIPANAVNYQLAENFSNPSHWSIWTLSPHTHKLGVDYDVFRLNNGQVGEQIFEGSENGYYNWTHPPIERYEPFLDLPAGAGFRHVAKYTNPSNSPVTLGLTTDNEMMITIVQYIEGEPIPFVGIPQWQDQYCIDADALSFAPSGGIATGAGTQNGQFIPSIAGVGTHHITYTYNYEGQDMTAEYDITITAIAAPTIEVHSQELTALGNYDTYQWLLNGQVIEGATGINYTANVSGNYSVLVTLGTCTANSEPVNVVVSGISSIAQQTLFQALPNPANDVLRFSYILPQTASVRIDVFSAIGQHVETIFNDKQTAGAHVNVWQTNGLPSGIYFAHINIGNETFVHKIAKQ